MLKEVAITRDLLHQHVVNPAPRYQTNRARKTSIVPVRPLLSPLPSSSSASPIVSSLVSSAGCTRIQRSGRLILIFVFF